MASDGGSSIFLHRPQSFHTFRRRRRRRRRRRPPSSPLLSTFGTLPIPDQVDDWTDDDAPPHCHCTGRTLQCGEGGLPGVNPGLVKSVDLEVYGIRQSHRI